MQTSSPQSPQQSAIATPEKLTADAANRLLSRGPRFRMDAEMVRDYALAAREQVADDAVVVVSPDQVNRAARDHVPEEARVAVDRRTTTER